jgi:alpha-N-acetylglucosaminidase
LQIAANINEHNRNSATPAWQNPVVYELALEMPWRIAPGGEGKPDEVDMREWVVDYAQRRYGGGSKASAAAWQELLSGQYDTPNEFSWSMHNVVVRQPELAMGYDNTTTNATSLVRAWGLLNEAAVELPSRDGPFCYDLVDVARQGVVNLVLEMYRLLQAVFAAGDKAAFEGLARAIVTAIGDLDALLETDVNYLLGPWLHDSKRWARSDADARWLEFNARNQVSLWGPDGNINDYAAKQWAGLVGTYHAKRWELFLAYARAALGSGQGFDTSAYHRDVLLLGQAWCNQTSTTDDFPIEASGSPVRASRELFAKYVPGLRGYKRVAGKDVPPGYDVMAAPTWTREPGQLSFLCSSVPTCVGFSSQGLLKVGGVKELQDAPGVDFYVRLLPRGA